MIPGVRTISLQANPDRRGSLVEMYRQSWAPKVTALQINLTFSRAGVLRGTHVHGIHTDYFVVARGEAIAGLMDVRKKSPGFRTHEFLTLGAEKPSALIVPPGVLHGIYFKTDSILVTVESSYFNAEEEIRCRWDDVGMAWPFENPIMSDQDREALGYEDMMAKIEPWQERYAEALEA